MSEFNYKQWLVENNVGPFTKTTVNELYHPDDPAGWDSAAARGEEDREEESDSYEVFVKKAIESASGDKISHVEEDTYGEPLYWGTKNPNVTYHIGSDDQIIKYDGETGERYEIGNLEHYDSDNSTDLSTENSIKEWGALDPEDYNAIELESLLKKLKDQGKINDANFDKAHDYIYKNAYDLYYDFRFLKDALKHVLKSIKGK